MEEMAEACDKDDKENKNMEQHVNSDVKISGNHKHNESGIDKSLNDSEYLNDAEDSLNDCSDKSHNNLNVYLPDEDKQCDTFVDKNLGNSIEEECSKSKQENNDISLSNDSFLSFGCMKKDDSGIDIGRSPTSVKETLSVSDADNSESVSESFTDSGALSRNDSVNESFKSAINCDSENMSISAKMETDASTQKETDDYMPQSIDTEDSEPCGNYDVTMSSAKDSDDELENAYKITKTKRKFRRQRLESDSDTDSNVDELRRSSNISDEETDNADVSVHKNENDLDSDDEKVDSKKSDSGDNSESEEEEQKHPKQLWKALYDIRDRELGYSNKSPPSVFREKVQGSVQMVQRFKLQSKLEYHEGCVNALHFNRIGTLLASGSDDLNIVLWNWIRSRPALIYDSGHRSNVFQAKFMPFSGDCHVVSCARDGQIRLAELSLTGVCKSTKKLAQHRGAAHKLALEFDSPHVFLSCGEDALVYEIDLRQEKPNKLSLTKENDRKVPLYSIHSNPSNSFEFCVGGRDHYVRIYDKRKVGSEEKETGLVKRFCPHHLVDSDVKANVTCAVYNYNGTEVIGSYNDEDIYLFSNQHSDGAEYIHRYTGHRNNATVKGVNFYGPKSEFIVSGSDCGHVFLWDKDSEIVTQFMEADEGGVINVLEPHPFAPVLATSGLDHDIKIWSPTAEEPTKLKGLKKILKRNKKEREEERVNEPDMLDGQMLWYIMHQLRRVRRRNEQRGNGGDGDGHESSSSENSDIDSDSLEEMPDRLQCAPS